jgi:hypothetical protein
VESATVVVPLSARAGIEKAHEPLEVVAAAHGGTTSATQLAELNAKLPLLQDAVIFPV